MTRVAGRNYRNNKIGLKSRKRKTVSMRIKESEFFLSVLAVLMVSVMGFSYVMQTNSMATKGYEVENYEEKLADLQSDYEDMKAREAELRSINNLSDKKDTLCAVSSGDIDFVDVSTTSIAMR